MAKEKNIHWFPGHMRKALIEAEEKIKLVDVIIEVLDARAPFSSRNVLLKNISSNKPRLIILNKTDLADKVKIDKASLKVNEKDIVIDTSLKSKSTKKRIVDALLFLGKEKDQKYAKKGMKPQLLRAIIVGIPNVGKSSIINLLAGKKSAGVANTPGFTRAQKWIKIENLFYLLDTPGILPAYYPEPKISQNLALIGCIKQDILPINELALNLVDFLKHNYLIEFNSYFKTDFSSDSLNLEILSVIGRDFKLKDGIIDINRTAQYLLKKFQDGSICKVYLD